MPTKVASLYAAIGADVSGLNRGLRQAQGAIGGFGKAFLGIGGLAVGAFTGISAAAIGIGKASVEAAATFEQGMNMLGVALRGTGADMKAVSDYALQMGADTIYNADEMVAAMTGLAKAGQDWETIAGDMSGATGTLAAATDLAAASDLDLNSAVDAVSVAMATFGLEASEATKIVDNYVQSADASVAEVSELVGSMKTIGPVAAQFGWSLKDVNTALALLSERGITAEMAGTTLRSMMAKMMGDTADVRETLDELNLELYTASGEMKDLPTIVDELSGALAGLTEEQRNSALMTLAGVRGQLALNTLYQAGGAGIEDMEAKIADAATAEEVADAATKGWIGALEQLDGALDTLKVTIGNELLPVLTSFVTNTLTPFVEQVTQTDWSKFTEPGKQFAAGWAEYDPQIVEKAREGLAGIEEQAPKTKEALDRLAIALGLVGGGPPPEIPGPVIGEPEGLAWDEVTWKNLGMQLAEDTEEFVEQTLGAFNKLLEGTAIVADALTEAIGDLKQGYIEASVQVQQAIAIVGPWAQQAIADIKSVATTLWTDLQAAWTQAVTDTETAITAITEWFQNLYESTVGADGVIPKFFGTMYEQFGAAVKRLREYGVNMVKALREGMLSQLESIKKAAEAIANAVTGRVTGWLGIDSPSKVFMDIGRNVGKGLELGLRDSISLPIDTMAAPIPGGGSTWYGNMNVYGQSDPQATTDAVIRRLQDRGFIAASPLR